MTTFNALAGSSHDRLTALINAANNAHLVEGVDFTFKGLASITPTSDYPNENTSILLTPTDLETFNEVIVFYTRLSIAVFSDYENDTNYVDFDSPQTQTHAVLGNINSALGLNLTTDEVENREYTTVALRYPLKITTTSLAWISSLYNFRSTTLFKSITEDGLDFITDEAGEVLQEEHYPQTLS